MPPGRPPVTPIAAATILLIRDGTDGLQVFMVQRSPRAGFLQGALVFPGGKVDPGDGEPALHDRCRRTPDLNPESVTLRAAGIRETFEECGVLLARPRGETGLVDAGRLAGIQARQGESLRGGSMTLGELAEREDLEPACDLLVPFAHWITPEFMPRRFDTHFFLAPAPEDQVALHDGQESVDSLWITPAAAEAEAEAGRWTIIFPTLLNLAKLGRSRDVAEALERARNEPIVTVLPQMSQGPDGPVVRIPPEAGYRISEAPAERLRG